ncbi:MAG: DUF3744 domain-containing protein [Clostridia bacterium]|nr:DUF3744 domain-containing protein [Clostridia bacterium]
MTDTVVRFENFSFRYLAQAEPTLYDISFSVRKGEKVLICGPSGCGKSTIAHCINGLIPFSYKGESTGSVIVGGKNAADCGLFECSKTVGTVLQDTDGQFVGMTVAEDIAFALENDCVPTEELKVRVKRVADIVSVGGHLHHAPNELSGGQKQRVSLAGVLVDDVDVLLFDEPLANLDPATGKAAIELIDDICRETGVAVIIIEHRVEDVLWRPVDRVILMNEGRIVSDTDPDTLLCTGLLGECGVREPLYVTALKYAGVNLTKEMHPAHPETLALSEADKERVRSWFGAAIPLQHSRTSEPVLEAKNLSFSYKSDRKALDDVSMTAYKGEVLAVVGTNGAGKSTLSKVVCGFETQQEGVVSLLGRDVAGDSIRERAESVGYVMQNPNQMISKVGIFDEVALGLRTRGVDEKEVTSHVEETLKVCGLYPFRNWPVSALSYGQKKRVTIASILVLEPKIIILDEPTAGQDYRHYTEIMEFLTELNRSGITVIMITHDMHLMLEYADRAVVFHDGKVIADATGAEILTDRALVKKADLKETSLYALAEVCGISDAAALVRRFIAHEERKHR